MNNHAVNMTHNVRFSVDMIPVSLDVYQREIAGSYGNYVLVGGNT